MFCSSDAVLCDLEFEKAGYEVPACEGGKRQRRGLYRLKPAEDAGDQGGQTGQGVGKNQNADDH
jgi:hypothetical protein